MTFIRKIGNKKYKYRSKRVDGKVVSEYVGPVTFWDKLKKHKDKIGSVALTLLITYLLIFAGPITAVRVGIDVDQTDQTYKANEDVTFIATVDIEYQTEKIPVQNLTLEIKNSTDSTIKTCTFSLGGSNLTACSNLSIAVINLGASGYGYGSPRWGYGYGYQAGYGYGTRNETFGYGYGYGYKAGYGYSTAYGAELQYNVTWDPSGANDGNYTATLNALVKGGGSERTFISEDPVEIMVDKTAPSISGESPSDSTTDTTPEISASYSDATSGINTSEVKLYVDGEDVTSDASVGSSSTSYTPTTSLTEGSHDVKLIVKDIAGNQRSFTWSFTVSVAAVGKTSTGSETGGYVYVPSIGEGETEKVDIPTFHFTGLSITASRDLYGTYVDIDLLDEKPEDVDVPEETVYNYYDFRTNVEDEDITDSTLSFKVPVSWYEGDLDPETTTLLRWHQGKWQSVDTTLTDSDSDYYYFEASVPGFSYFTITAQAVPVCGNGVLEAGEECETDADCLEGYSCEDCTCLAQAKFEVTNLRLPAEVQVNESVTISADVRNTGEIEGTQTVTLKIDEKVEETRRVTLKGGESRTVTFTITKPEGTYTVNVDGLTGSFEVKKPKPVKKRIPSWVWAVLAVVIIVIVIVIVAFWYLKYYKKGTVYR